MTDMKEHDMTAPRRSNAVATAIILSAPMLAVYATLAAWWLT